MIFTTSVLAISVFSILMAFMLFLRVRQQNTSANYLLMFWLSGLCVFVIMLFLIRTGIILEAPWLYRLPSPFYYLVFPAAWLYVRMVIKDETRLRKTDWLHALPALLHLVEMLPYYFSSYQHKTAVVLADISNPLGAFRHAEGWMPDYIHNILRGIQAIGYAIAMLVLLRRFYKRNEIHAFTFSKTFQWLKMIAAGQLIFGMSLFLLLEFSHLGTPQLRGFLLYILLGSMCTFWSAYLVLHPGILRAMPRLKISNKSAPGDQLPVQNELADQFASTVEYSSLEFPKGGNQLEIDAMEVATKEPLPIPEAYFTYRQKLQQYMNEHKSYLEARYSINQLALDLQIPKHHLTYLLNQVMHTRFNDYINQQRITHIQQQIASGALKNHTLEALALEAGFNSRITFIRAVQRATGKNPSAYFRATEPKK